MEVYLVLLTNYEDEQCCMVDKETMDWIHSPRPVFINNGAYENFPPNLAKVYEENEEDTKGAYVSSGSCENDRAMYCRSIPEHYDETSDLETVLEQFQQAGDTIVGVYVGSIY